MNVSSAFIDDLRYLRDYYEWSRDDVAEVKAAIKGAGEPLVHYFTVLAAAHRAGYAQDAANGFIRLQAWCKEKGLPRLFELPINAGGNVHPGRNGIDDQAEMFPPSARGRHVLFHHEGNDLMGKPGIGQLHVSVP